jgi:hypothetical protein
VAHLVHVQQEWDFAVYGSVDITWTDDSGSHSITAISTGKYRHVTSAADSLTHPSGGTAIANTANASFAAALQTLMDAATAQTVTVTYSNTTNRYTVACSGAVFSIDWTTPADAAHLRMRSLLGFAANLSGATSYTSTQAPYHTLEPRAVGLVGWTEPRALTDSVSTRVTSAGSLVTVGPSRVPYSARFDLANESNAQTLLTFETRYCWERFFRDAGRYGRLCYLLDMSPPVGSDVKWAFQLRTPVWDESTHRRERPELTDRWRVTVDALIRGSF